MYGLITSLGELERRERNERRASELHNFLREEGLIQRGSENDAPLRVSNVDWRTKLLAAVQKAIR